MLKTFLVVKYNSGQRTQGRSFTSWLVSSLTNIKLDTNKLFYIYLGKLLNLNQSTWIQLYSDTLTYSECSLCFSSALIQVRCVPIAAYYSRNCFITWVPGLLNVVGVRRPMKKTGWKIFECRSKSKKLNDGLAGLDEHEQNEIIPKTKINVLSGILNISFHLFT